MANRVRKVHFLGVVESRDDVSPLLQRQGDLVIVERGYPRLLVMRCPCGCGDDLIINLDKKAGPAWRHYLDDRGLTLYPSYWRDSACGSHFVIWNSNIYWCFGWGSSEQDDPWDNVTEVTEKAILDVLPDDRFINFYELAETLDYTPWEVFQACRQLVKQGKAVTDKKRDGHNFKKVSKSKRPLSWFDIIFGKKD